jgi:hypothetical protein
MYGPPLRPLPGLTRTPEQMQEQAKAKKWVQQFIDVFGSDVQSSTVQIALAVEKKLPGFAKELKEAFDKVAPPGSPQREHGEIELMGLLPQKVLRNMERYEEIVDSFPPNEEYERTYKNALRLADHITAAAVRQNLSPLEFEAITNRANLIVEQHHDDGLRAIANTILMTAKAAERYSRSPEYRAAKAALENLNLPAASPAPKP